MKFRIISVLVLLVVLGLFYVIFEANQPTPGREGAPDNGGAIVLH